MSRKTYSFGAVLPPQTFNRANYEKQCEGIREAMAVLERPEFFGEESLTDAELPWFQLSPALPQDAIAVGETHATIQIERIAFQPGCVVAYWRKLGAK
jgi:hypothetical protein